MINKKKINKAIVDELQVNEDGLESVKIVDLEEIQKLGIVDISEFLNGILDAENNEEFSGSQTDYVKGYKYAKTGQF